MINMTNRNDEHDDVKQRLLNFWEDENREEEPSIDFNKKGGTP